MKPKDNHWDFILLDFIALAVSYWLAYNLRFYKGSFLAVYRHQIIILLFAITASSVFGRPFSNVMKRGMLVELRETFLHTLQLMLINILCLFIIHEANVVSRLFMGYQWGTYFALSYGSRLLLKRYLRRKNYSRRSAAILVASSGDAQKIIEDSAKSVFLPYFFDAIFLTDFKQEGISSEIQGITVKGGLEHVIDFATHNWVDEAMLCIPENQEASTLLSDTLCMMGIKTHTILARINKSNNELNVQYPEQIGSYVVTTQEQRVVPVTQTVLKRTVDIFGGIVGCLITGILFCFVAPAIYMKSPGPVFFVQQRVGKNGKFFKMYKFRSMYMDADERKKDLMQRNEMNGGMMFKIFDDPRIIGSEKKDKYGNPKGIGNFIRRTSIDEFPQFLNVLKGDMSLVGTRPPTLDEYVLYSAEHKARLSMRPGITGLWQVSGRNKITNFDEIVELDTEYIRTWNFALDIKILGKSVGAVLKHEGAE